MELEEALKILSETKAKTATARLVKATATLAYEVRDKMETVDALRSIDVPGYGVLACITRHSNVGKWTYLATPSGSDLTTEKIGGGYYIHDDIHKWVDRATGSERLAFARSADSILAALAAAESKIAAQADAASTRVEQLI